MKYFVALLLSAVLFVACGDESSSSAPAPDPSEESSSSVEMTKESSSSATNKNSSSSVSGDKSSSSVKKEDSSSSVVKTSSSSSSVTPKSSSSEEVKQSSSSVMASSSSVVEESSSSRNWQPFNLANYGDKYEEFTDDRNGRTYKYLKFEGKDTSGKAATIHAMVENLNVGDFVWGHKDQKDDSKIERYCYDDDTLNCHYYGGLYQWAEMMQLPNECNTKSCADLIKPNHQGICPDGWRLLTYNDYYIIVNSNGNKDGVKGTRSTFGFGGSNDTGFSLVGTGYRTKDGRFGDLNDYTIWFYPQEHASQEERSSCNGMTRDKTTISPGYQSKVTGTSVRCVMVE